MRCTFSFSAWTLITRCHWFRSTNPRSWLSVNSVDMYLSPDWGYVLPRLSLTFKFWACLWFRTVYESSPWFPCLFFLWRETVCHLRFQSVLETLTSPFPRHVFRIGIFRFYSRGSPCVSSSRAPANKKQHHRQSNSKSLTLMWPRTSASNFWINFSYFFYGPLTKSGLVLLCLVFDLEDSIDSTIACIASFMLC